MTSAQRSWGWPACVWLAMAAQCTVTIAYSLTLHYTFKTSAYDIGDFTQLLYRQLEGQGFTVTLAPPGVTQHWFAIHFSPILYLLVPLYALWSDPIIIRTFAPLLLASAAFPLFLCARRITKHDALSAIIAICYLFNPFVFNAAIWDFHEVSFAPLLFACAYLALLDKKKGWFVACCLLLLATKEHYGASVACFGALWGWHHREYRFGLALAVFGLLTLAVILGFVMPHFQPLGEHFMFKENGRFAWLHQPLQSGKLFLLALDDFPYLMLLAMGGLMVGLRAPLWLLPGASDLGVNMLSMNGMLRDPQSYHSAALMVVFSVATAQGIVTLMANNRKLQQRDAIIALLIVAAGLTGFLAVPHRSNLWEFDQVQFAYNEHDKAALQDIRALIPRQDGLAAQNNVGAHFGDRLYLYHFPNQVDPATWVLLRLDFPYRSHKDVFSSPYGVSCDIYLKYANRYIWNAEWNVAYWQPPWLLLHKGRGDMAIDLDAIEKALASVRQACIAAGTEME